MTTAKAECEALMNTALPYAERMLRTSGEFFPFGGGLTEDGRIESLAAGGGGKGGNGAPTSAPLERLRAKLAEAARAGRYRATAAVFDARVARAPGADAAPSVAVELDHRDGYSVVVFVPYAVTAGEVQFGELFARAGEAKIFSAR